MYLLKQFSHKLIITTFSTIESLNQTMQLHIQEQNDGRFGYIIISEDLEDTQIILDALAINNFDEEIIVTLNKKFPEILLNNWIKHKMLKLVGASLQELNSSGETTLLRYDPFSRNVDDFGEVLLVKLRSHNYLTQIKMFIGNIASALHDVKGYPIRICIFEIQGQVKALKSENGTIVGYTGGNIQEISLILNASNFSQTYVFPPTGEGYGTIHNGTPTGQVWVMEKGLADISANMRMIMLPNLVKSTFLYSTGDLVAVFMTPKQRDFFKMQYLNILDENVYIMIALSHSLVLITWLVNDIIRKKMVSAKIHKFSTTSTIIMRLIGSATLVALNLLYEKILFGSMLLIALVLSCSYQGTMYKFLSIGKVSGDINTLNGVLQTNLEIMLSASNKPEPNYKFRDNIYDKILKKATFVTNIKASLDKVNILLTHKFLNFL